MASSTIPAGSGGGLSPKLQKFTTSGTFTLPDGYGAAKPLLIDIQVIGGGGAGSGSQTNAVSAYNTGVFAASQHDYFGNTGTFLSNAFALPTHPAQDFSNNQNGAGGGSGGLAKTQMYLTGNLTITVGAAGTRPAAGTPNAPTGEQTYFWKRDMPNSNNLGGNYNTYNATPITFSAGGAGGTSTAGSVSATGGNAAAATTGGYQYNVGGNNWSRANGYTPSTNATPTVVNYALSTATTVGTGGQPAGTSGGATPLLGAMAGGSGTTTPVYGAFGVGGKRGDTTTHSGVDGTGGGYGSIGASGAVIITYWS